MLDSIPVAQPTVSKTLMEDFISGSGNNDNDNV